MPVNLSSYDSATVGNGAIISHMQQAYNACARLVSYAQDHGGPCRGRLPTAGLSDANCSANTVRPMGMDYAGGRSPTFDDGASSGISDYASRIASLIDDDGTTHLVDYSLLGWRAIVVVNDTKPDVPSIRNMTDRVTCRRNCRPVMTSGSSCLPDGSRETPSNWEPIAASSPARPSRRGVASGGSRSTRGMSRRSSCGSTAAFPGT